MNKKGFTLVELLASLIILSIIMLIAVPSTINVLDRTKKEKYISDSKKFITLAETYLRGHEDINYPKNNEIVVFYLSFLNDGTFEDDAEGNPYSLDESFVAVTYKQEGSNYKYEYDVQLVGKGSNGKVRGVKLANLNELNSRNKNDYVTKNISTMSCSAISNKVFGNNSGVCTNYN